MKSLLETKLDKKDFIFEMEHTVNSTGIGIYEYWGARFYDEGEEYISGTVYITFYGSFTKKETAEFIFLHEDELEDLLLERTNVYEDVEITEKVDSWNKGDKTSFYLRFTAA
ncbi:MAG: hypothetical protein DRJ01_01020 [Bacteroidetes bacterium]|nr:MAG: hypothetical protein DRJ01_01020 [Bacteroidota bacterium]